MPARVPIVERIMKKTNKLVAAVLVAVMAVPMAMPVFAEGDADNTKNTKLVYTVDCVYEWSVPAQVDFGKNGGVSKTDISGNADEEGKVEVTQNIIPEGKKLVITAKGNGTENAFTIKNKLSSDPDTFGTEELTYEVKVGTNETPLKKDGMVLEVPAGTNQKSVNLAFTLHTTDQRTAEIAGSYEGTMTYTAAIVDAN